MITQLTTDDVLEDMEDAEAADIKDKLFIKYQDWLKHCVLVHLLWNGLASVIDMGEPYPGQYIVANAGLIYVNGTISGGPSIYMLSRIQPRLQLLTLHDYVLHGHTRMSMDVGSWVNPHKHMAVTEVVDLDLRPLMCASPFTLYERATTKFLHDGTGKCNGKKTFDMGLIGTMSSDDQLDVHKVLTYLETPSTAINKYGTDESWSAYWPRRDCERQKTFDFQYKQNRPKGHTSDIKKFVTRRIDYEL